MPILRDTSYVRDAIEQILGGFCDGTLRFNIDGAYFSLRDANFVEYGAANSPQFCADRLVAYVEELLKDHGHV